MRSTLPAQSLLELTQSTELPDWRPTFPNWKGRPLERVVRNLDPAGVDLLSKMLVYDPKQRISAAEALEHPYFEGFEEATVRGPAAGASGQPRTVAAGSVAPTTSDAAFTASSQPTLSAVDTNRATQVGCGGGVAVAGSGMRSAAARSHSPGLAADGLPIGTADATEI